MLESVWKVYSVEIANLKKAISDLVSAITQLKSSAWKTDGADEFFRNYDSTWKVHIEDHISYMEHLHDCLVKARSEFGIVYQQRQMFY